MQAYALGLLVAAIGRASTWAQSRNTKARGPVVQTRRQFAVSTISRVVPADAPLGRVWERAHVG